MKRRILVFCSESRGLGHLKRLVQISQKLADTHSVLIVTSEVMAGDLIKPPLEYVRITPLDTSDLNRTRHWDRSTFSPGIINVALSLRTELIAAIFHSFRPNVMLTDFFPNGRGGELLPHLSLSEGRCINYLVLRGILGKDAYSHSRIFSPQGIRSLGRYYARAFIACDSRILKATEYNLPADIEQKCMNVGYVYTPIDDAERSTARAVHKIRHGIPWIVCAGGSGLNSERLIQCCYEFALGREDCEFTIVLGPRSRLHIGQEGVVPHHIRLRTYVPKLALLLASCDVAVLHGGYNSLLEGVYGGAIVTVVPNEGEEEQSEHAKRLSVLADVRLTDLNALEKTLTEAISDHLRRPLTRPLPLDIGGAEAICSLINSDVARLNL